MQTFFGLSINKACLGYPRINKLWTKKKKKMPVISNAMTRNRFFKLKHSLKKVKDLDVSEETKKSDFLWKDVSLSYQIKKYHRSSQKREVKNIKCKDNKVYVYSQFTTVLFKPETF